jgi:hypothetical protein
MIDPSIRMRDDLARDDVEVPAWTNLDAPATYLKADDLRGARFLPDLCDESSPEYNYNRIELADKRVFFMVGVDLDFGELK